MHSLAASFGGPLSGWLTFAFGLGLVGLLAAAERDSTDLRFVEIAAIGSGLVSIALLAHTYWRLRAAGEQAEATRQSLQDMIDALPAGVVLYDRDERLTAFNKAAESMSGGVISPTNLGRTFPELQRMAADISLRRGVALTDDPEIRIARFRRRDEVALWQTFDGSWIERYERATPAGGTITVGVDVSERKRHELELRRAHNELQEIVDALPVGVVVYDKDTRVRLFNREAGRMISALGDPDAIGLSQAELLKRTFESFGGHGPHDFSLEEMTRRFEERRREVHRLPDGRWLDLAEVPGPDGGTVGLRVDVTDLKNLEIAAREAEAAYQTLVDSLSDTVFQVDPNDGLILFVSGGALQLFGRPPAELIGTPFLDHVVADDHEVNREALRAAAQAPSGSMREVQYRMRHCDGGIHHVEVRFTRSRDAAGRDLVAGVIRDVSARIALEVRLDQEVGRLRAIVQSSGAMVVLLDRDRIVLMVNREFERLTGVPEAVAIGRPATDFLEDRLDPELYRRWREETLQASDAVPASYGKHLVDPKGRMRLLAMTATPILDERGRVQQIVLLGVDDTERREAEQGLHNAERLATVGEMAGAVVHEIAQPLMTIELARSSVLADIEGGVVLDPQFVAAKMTRIGQQVERANRIVSDLRAFVRGASADSPGAIDLAEAIRSVVDMTQHAMRLAKVQLEVRVAPGLPPAWGLTGKIDQVLINLVNNARDAGATRIELEAAVVDSDDGARLRLAVLDNGPGIPEQVLGRLFDQMVTTKPKGVGTGLGLRICRRIVEEMRGTISAANRPEGGARFEILLPLASREPESRPESGGE